MMQEKVAQLQRKRGRKAAGLVLPFLPLLPIPVLLTNLIYDVAQIGLPLDHVDLEAIGVVRVDYAAWTKAGANRARCGPTSTPCPRSTRCG